MSLTSANARLSVFGLATAGGRGRRRRRRSPRARLRLGAAARPPRSSSSPGCSPSGCPRHVDVPTGELPADVLTTAEIPVGRGRRRPGEPARRARPAGQRRAARPRRLPHDLRRVPRAGHLPRRLGGHPRAGRRSPRRPGVGQLRRHGGRFAAARRDPGPARPPLRGVGGGDHRAGGGLLQLRDGRGGRCSSPRSPTPWARSALDAIIQREVPESLRASAFARSETWLQLAWVVGGALRHRAARRPAGSASPSPRRCSSLAVGLILWSLLPRRHATASDPTSPLGASTRTHDRAVGAAVVVSRCAAALLLLVLAGCGRGRRPAPANVQVAVGGEKVAVRPTQYCLDGDGQRYTTPRRSSRSRPDAPITLTVPDVGRRAGLERAGLRREAREAIGEVDVAQGQGGVRPRSTPPTSSRRRSTSSSSRTRAATAGSSPAPGRSASSAPAATWRTPSGSASARRPV